MAVNATLCYIVRDNTILLIYKKKGFGAGKWNGAGGKIESNETPEEASTREMAEETGIRPIGAKNVGTLEFYFGHTGDPDMVVHVFAAEKFSGQVRESEEAIPKWFDVRYIPFDKMWPDDRLWFPLMLRGQKFSGKFYFDKSMERLINHSIELIEG